ncbi:MAG: DMT family transporter [Rhodospirillaceae bacterium]|nr:DMT family transporter [Rhodospirillaceae bacterium]MBT4588842.1 DMT family transporter [Rhodospirillaceae bacterium]MBT4939491.1 DMT family transporter [Rhodospirillaceae bacterium]MBT5940978.1 DMT family transporter [Rhodospirillaceae bacterium]
MAAPQDQHTPPNISIPVAYLMIAITVLLWSISVVIAKGVHEEIPLVGLTFWRWVTAVIVLIPFVWKDVRDNLDLVRRHWKIYLAQGTFMVGGGTLLFTSLNFTTAINASLVNTTQPAVTALLTWIILKDRLKNIQYVGIASAIVGVVFMIAKADLAVLINLELNIGDFIVIFAILSYSMYAINLRKLPPGLGTFPTLFVILFFGTFPLLPFYIGETILVGPVPFTLETVFWSVILAIIVSIGSLALWNNGNRVVGPHRAAVFVSLMPVYGSILATTFLGEEVFSYHIIGAVFVCAGIFMVVRNH